MIFNYLNLDIIHISKSPDLYYFKPRQIYFQSELQIVRESIYVDCPCPMYQDSYHIHQVGSWGPLPAIIHLYRKLNNEGKLKTLDIGCAFGTLAAYCSSIGYEASAIDFVPLEKYLGYKTQEKYNIEYKQVSIESEDMPWGENIFNIVTMSEVLEHFRYQPLGTLKKIRNSLKPGGVLLITTPALGVHWPAEFFDCDFEDIPANNGQFDNDPDKHWKIYSAMELNRLLDMAGFNSSVTMFININTGMESLYAVAVKKEKI